MREKAVYLKKGEQGIGRPGHPWIYRDQIRGVTTRTDPGDVVSVLNPQGKIACRGYYNPKSEIAVRALTFKDEAIDKKFFDAKVLASFGRRKALLEKTNAVRAVFSEADSLPGLIVDLYAETAVFQVLTLGMECLKKTLVKSIQDACRPAFLYEKSESPYRRLEGLEDARKWWGGEGNTRVEIREGRARFLVDIAHSHKTGFYLDQRKSRLAMAGISKGKKVLDLFCYTGAFGITAAVWGAASARGVDIKREWLELGSESARLNGVSEKVCFTKGDAFAVLKDIHDSGERFDIIIIDQPSFVKNRRRIATASRGYRELNHLAMKTLGEKGVLATFSCSHMMSNDIFSSLLKETAAAAGKKINILKRCHQAEDHPIVKAIPETEYLKGYFLE